MFGERLKELRKQKGLSQKELAKKLGITQQGVSSLEKLEDPPKVKTIEKLANVLDVSPNDFFYYELDFDSPIPITNERFPKHVQNFLSLLPDGYNAEWWRGDEVMTIVYPDEGRIPISEYEMLSIMEDLEDLIIIKLDRIRKSRYRSDQDHEDKEKGPVTDPH